MGKRSVDAFVNYLELITHIHGALNTPFDDNQRFLVNDSPLNKIFKRATQRIKDWLNKYCQNTPMMNDDVTHQQSFLHGFVKFYRVITKSIRLAVNNHPKKSVIINNYLLNILKSAHTNDERHAYLTRILFRVHQSGNPNTYDAFYNELLNDLNSSLTLEKLILIYKIVNESHFIILLSKYFNQLHKSQDDISNFIKDSLRGALEEISPDQMAVKRLLEGPIFSKVKLKKNKPASIIREFVFAIYNTIAASSSIHRHALRFNWSPLTQQEQLKLRLLLTPYYLLSITPNPFHTLPWRQLYKNHLKVVLDTSGDRYIGYIKHGNQQKSDDAIELFIRHFSKIINSDDANHYFNLIALCTASYNELSTFTHQLQVKYSHRLEGISEFTKLCNGFSDSIAIKTVQLIPKLYLLAIDLYQGNTAEAERIKYWLDFGNDLMLSGYYRAVLIVTDDHTSKSIQFYHEQLSTEKKLMKATIKESLRILGEQTYSSLVDITPIILTLLAQCKKYYALSADESLKSKMLANKINRAIATINNSKNTNLIDVAIPKALDELSIDRTYAIHFGLFKKDSTIQSVCEQIKKAILAIESYERLAFTAR